MTRTIFIAARVHTMNARSAGRAVLVEDGRVRAVGSVDSVRAGAPDARIVDFGQATLTPGLVDAHIHMTEWSVARAQLDLSHARSIDDAVQAVAGAARSNGDWLLGRGWNPHAWGGAYPSRDQLDAVVADAPVVLQSHDMHALWLNSRALERIGSDRLREDPDGGRIMRDTRGEPTGILLETAAQLVVPHVPAHTIDSILPLVLDAQSQLHQYGITGVHSFPGVHLIEPDPFPVLQKLHASGQLKLRVLQHIAVERLDAAIAVGLMSGFGNEWLRVGAVKMFLDGALGSRTAWMREPYENSADRGVCVLAEDDFRAIVEKAATHGIATVVHAIGDAAVTVAFDVLSRDSFRVPALPHRVEHVQCLPRDLADRLGKQVVCSVQPSHLMTDWTAADKHWGKRAADTYAFRFMLDSGAVLACGSDAPVEPADPRHGLYAAVARRDLSHEPQPGWQTDQCITPLEVLAGYTTGAAHVAGIAPELRGIAPGALADFVAWNQDPLGIDPKELLTMEASATVVGGHVVYTK